jgi:hypothetical protein
MDLERQRADLQRKKVRVHHMKQYHHFAVKTGKKERSSFNAEEALEKKKKTASGDGDR